MKELGLLRLSNEEWLAIVSVAGIGFCNVLGQRPSISMLDCYLQVENADAVCKQAILKIQRFLDSSGAYEIVE
jgi:hypothetical protein